LEFDSKIASAGAMKWIENTVLGQSEMTEAEKPDSTGENGENGKHSGKHSPKTAKKVIKITNGTRK
jgi:hypothetical protein